jgi:hypothetical protein
VSLFALRIITAVKFHFYKQVINTRMVSPAEWGPNAWELLHGLCERVGNQTNITLIRDEQNELRFTLKNFWALMPCQKCQQHYREWLRKHNPDSFLTKTGEYLQDDMREWVYRLHNNVNEQREAVVDFKESDLKSRYEKINLRAAANNLKTVYQRGLQLNILKPEEWKKTYKHLDLLLRFIGV